VTCIISDVFCPTILTLVNNDVVNLVLDFQFPSALPIDLFICLSLNFSLTCFLLVNQRPGILQNQEFLYDKQWTGYRSFVIYPCNFTITWTIYILFRPLKYASLKALGDSMVTGCLFTSKRKKPRAKMILLLSGQRVNMMPIAPCPR